MKSLLSSWLSSLGVGLVTAVVGAIVGGFVATLAVTWQRIPSREGTQGYFVYNLVILAAIAGLLIGLVVSRLLAQSGNVPLLRAIAVATAVHLALIGIIGGLTRLLSHVPPTFEGEKLLLAVELSWPEAQAPQIPSGDAPPHLALAIGGATAASDSRAGVIWTDDARRENGRYVVPGVVEVWTERKARMLSVNTGTLGTDVATFQVPLPARPGKAQRAWSEWLPVASGQLQYRLRVVKRNEPVRTIVIGPFTIGTAVRRIDVSYSDDAGMWLTAETEFLVTHKGAPVRVSGPVAERDYYDPDKEPRDSIARYAVISEVAVVPGLTPALVVQVDASYGSGYTYLLQSTGDSVRATYLSHSGSGETLADPLMPVDTTGAPIAEARVYGLVDERSFRSPGLYLTASAVLDTRTLRVYRLPLHRRRNDLDKKPPLSLSPDEHRYVRIAGGDSLPVLSEIAIATGVTRTVPVGLASAPTGNYEDVDREWFDHYFTWEPDASGSLRVVARPSAHVMPHRGTLTQKTSSREYRVDGVKVELHEALVSFVEATMQGVRGMHTSDDGYRSTEVAIGPDTVTVAFSSGRVSVWVGAGAKSLIVATIARKFDEALATRRYDALFGPAPNADTPAQ